MTAASPAFTAEKQDIERWFRRTVLSSAIILGGLAAEVAISVFFGVGLLPAAAYGIVKLLPAAITALFGENRLFPKRTMWNLYGRSPYVWAALSSAGFAATALYPVSILSVAAAFTTSYMAQLLSASGFTALTLLTAVRQLRRRVEIDIPNWARAGLWGSEGIMGESVWNRQILRKLQGMPVAIVNRTSRPVILTMVWLEWFAQFPWIPRGFQRQYGGWDRETYCRRMIMLDESAVLKPNDAKILVLKFDEAGAFHDELRRRNMVGAEMAYALITVYDEYADRVRGSRKIALQEARSPIFREFLEDRKTEPANPSAT